MANVDKKECLINGVEYKCRTCFDPGRNIYPLTDEASNKKTWLDLLKDITKLQANDEEKLPKTLCCICSEKLKKAYEFILQIQDVNEKYSELLAKNDFLMHNDNLADCLAESAIALPLEQYVPEIKMEEEMVMAYDNKSGENNEDNFDNDDDDDPFTETFDTEKATDSMEEVKEEKESAKRKTGGSTIKRNRGKKIKPSKHKSEELSRTSVKRTRKSKQPKKPTKTTPANETKEMEDLKKENEGKETIVCGKCSQTFYSFHKYQKHQQAEHSSELADEKNKCPICSKEFRKSWYVLHHIKVVHDKLKPHKCSQCPKSFASALSKRNHELIHTDNFPYACEYCNKRFRIYAKLKVHIEIHTTKPELLCHICHRSQKSEEELEIHIKNHDDNRLQCPSCGNLYRRSSQLKDHYNAVHLKLRPYKCEFCELGFGDRKTRRVHQRIHRKHELSIPKQPLPLEDAYIILDT